MKYIINYIVFNKREFFGIVWFGFIAPFIVWYDLHLFIDKPIMDVFGIWYGVLAVALTYFYIVNLVKEEKKDVTTDRSGGNSQ